MSTENVALVRRMYEAANRGDVDAVEEIFAPDFYSHPMGKSGTEPVRAAWRTIFERFPGIRISPDEIIDDGDRVAVWASVHGVPGGGSPPRMMELIRVADGRIAEVWGLSTLSWR